VGWVWALCRYSLNPGFNSLIHEFAVICLASQFRQRYTRIPVASLLWHCQPTPGAYPWGEYRFPTAPQRTRNRARRDFKASYRPWRRQTCCVISLEVAFMHSPNLRFPASLWGSTLNNGADFFNPCRPPTEGCAGLGLVTWWRRTGVVAVRLREGVDALRW